MDSHRQPGALESSKLLQGGWVTTENQHFQSKERELQHTVAWLLVEVVMWWCGVPSSPQNLSSFLMGTCGLIPQPQRRPKSSGQWSSGGGRAVSEAAWR